MRSQIIQPQESLILYESFNTLEREVRKVGGGGGVGNNKDDSRNARATFNIFPLR